MYVCMYVCKVKFYRCENLVDEIDDSTKGGLTLMGTFYRDSLCSQRFQILITSLCDDI